MKQKTKLYHNLPVFDDKITHFSGEICFMQGEKVGDNWRYHNENLQMGADIKQWAKEKASQKYSNHPDKWQQREQQQIVICVGVEWQWKRWQCECNTKFRFICWRFEYVLFNCERFAGWHRIRVIWSAIFRRLKFTRQRRPDTSQTIAHQINQSNSHRSHRIHTIYFLFVHFK